MLNDDMLCENDTFLGLLKAKTKTRVRKIVSFIIAILGVLTPLIVDSMFSK